MEGDGDHTSPSTLVAEVWYGEPSARRGATARPTAVNLSRGAIRDGLGHPVARCESASKRSPTPPPARVVSLKGGSFDHVHGRTDHCRIRILDRVSLGNAADLDWPVIQK